MYCIVTFVVSKSVYYSVRQRSSLSEAETCRRKQAIREGVKASVCVKCLGNLVSIKIFIHMLSLAGVLKVRSSKQMFAVRGVERCDRGTHCVRMANACMSGCQMTQSIFRIFSSPFHPARRNAACVLSDFFHLSERIIRPIVRLLLSLASRQTQSNDVTIISFGI